MSRVGDNDCHAWANVAAANLAAAGYQSKSLGFTGTVNGGHIEHAVCLLYGENGSLKYADNRLKDDPAGDSKKLIRKFRDVMNLGTYGLRHVPPFEDNTPATGKKIATALFCDFWNRSKPSISSATFILPPKPKP